MNTQEFMALILPDGNNFFVVEVPVGGGPVTHHHASNANQLANMAVLKDTASNTSNTYYALASYKEEQYIDSKGKTRKRTQENVDKLKCFWVDLDCKGKDDGSDYPNQLDAARDISRFCNEISLPLPMVVNSGYGVHAYWVLDESISRDTWVEVAGRFRSTLDAHKVRHDSSCTTDCARILRAVGTHNKKVGVPDRLVRLIGQEKAVISLKTFSDALSASPAASFSPITGGAYAGADMSLNEMAKTIVEYQPSSIKEIVKECALINAIGKLGGDVAEPLWHKTLGLVKHTLEGAQAIHIFSKGHKDYTPEATKAKADAWSADGPPSCEVIHKDAPPNLKTHCDSCKHKGLIKGPIALGYPKIMLTETVVSIVADKLVTTTIEVPALPPSMQHSYKWEDEKLWRSVVDKDASKEAGQRVFVWVPFCDFYFYPFSYYDDEAMKHYMVWRLREREGVYREFTLSGGAMGAGGQLLFKELGEQSVTAITNAKPHMEAYIANFMVDVKKKAPSTTTYTSYGWNGEDFLIGDTLIESGTGKHSKVRLGGSAEGLSKYFIPKGTTARWTELIDKVYGYPGQEQFQFILCTGFGSPLLHLMGCKGGCAVSAVSPTSGHGKSTAGMLATGMYGSARSGELTLTREQATDKAIFALAGTLNGIPIMVDEMTGVAPLVASSIIYTHSQGSGRITLHQNGTLNLGRKGWSSIMNMSANASMSSLILSVKPGAEAELARMIEFTIENSATLEKGIADLAFEELFNLHGHVGLAFMTFVQANATEVRARLKKVQTMLDKRLKLERKDRYWSYGIAGTITGAMIAKELGLISFDIKNILLWLESRVLDIRKEAAATVATPTQIFSSMLTELSPGFIVTDIEGDKRSKIIPTMIREPRAPYTGRVVVDSHRLYIPQPMMHSWCVEHQVSMKALITDMSKIGWITNQGDTVMKFPAKGTHITMGQFRCFEVDTSMLEASSEVAPDFANVISIFKKESAV